MYAEIILPTSDAVRAEQQQQQQAYIKVGKNLKRERSKESCPYTESVLMRSGQRLIPPILS